MLIRKAYKFAIKPKKEQSQKIRKFCGCARFVYNKALAWQNEQYENDDSFKFSYLKIANLLLEWKNQEGLEWLKECHSQVLQQSLKDLEKAFKNFFARRANFPRYKKKSRKDSFRFPQAFKLDQENKRIYLPKIGWIRYRDSRRVIGTVKNVTVSIKCGKYFISIQTEYEQEPPIPTGGEIGIDMGIKRFATLSNGRFFAPLNPFKTYKGRLAKLQRRLKTKKKFSRRWKKLQAKISKLHHKIANCRKDYLHKISSEISKNQAMVYMEDLKVFNMSKSASGTKEQPGQNVKQKSGLNRAILDQGWFEFRRQLDYKLFWNGGHLITVPAKNTSRTCPACGFISKDNRKTQSNFECLDCGYSENADVVGAINILNRGRLIMAEIHAGGARPKRIDRFHTNERGVYPSCELNV